MDLKLLYKFKFNLKTTVKISKADLKFYLKKMEWITHSNQTIEITEQVFANHENESVGIGVDEEEPSK